VKTTIHWYDLPNGVRLKLGLDFHQKIATYIQEEKKQKALKN